MKTNAVFKGSSSRSPLKDKPLRLPGQSTDEAMQKILDDDVTESAAIIALVLTFAIYEWVRAFTAAPPQPLVITACAAIAAAWAVRKIILSKRKLTRLRQGRDGERIVAEQLEHLRRSGFTVFHDVMGPEFNVDHVIVGPQGLFAIETKTITKPAQKATIEYDGETVTLAGFRPDRNPLVQAVAVADWLRNLVRQSTGRNFTVRPIVLYPGWWVDNAASKNKKVWVLNPDVLEGFIKHEQRTLKEDEVKLIAFHLSRYARSAYRG